jgi:hypothetical protein
MYKKRDLPCTSNIRSTWGKAVNTTRSEGHEAKCGLKRFVSKCFVARPLVARLIRLACGVNTWSGCGMETTCLSDWVMGHKAEMYFGNWTW